MNYLENPLYAKAQSSHRVDAAPHADISFKQIWHGWLLSDDGRNMQLKMMTDYAIRIPIYMKMRGTVVTRRETLEAMGITEGCPVVTYFT